MSGYELHSHAYIGREPHCQGQRDITHSHEGGDSAHQHADYGPAHYSRGGRRRPKFTKKPNGPQLALVELEEWQRTFRVVFVDHYTSEHLRSAGTTREDFDRQREDFRRCMAGDGIGGMVAERMINEFDMTPVYEIVGGAES